MAKRGATEQITKDTWERDDDGGGRDRSEEPAEVASQAVLAKRKILKPKSRVGGAAPSASAAPSAPSASSASSSSGLFNFGPPKATPAAAAAAQKPLFPSNLFGGPSSSSSSSSSPSSAATGLFGAPQPSSSSSFSSSTPLSKPPASLFGFPQQNAPAEAPKSLFGFSAAPANPQSTFGQASSSSFSSTTPTATPAKAPSSTPFNIFTNVNSATADPSSSSAKQDAPPKPPFGLQPKPPTPAQPPKDDSAPLFSLSKPPPNPFAPSAFSPKTESKPESKDRDARPDPLSLDPPPGSDLSRDDMPSFNWLYQVRSLNHQFGEQVKKALAEDPYADLTTWVEFYQKQLLHFASLKSSQQQQLRNGTVPDHTVPEQKPTPAATTTPSKASKLFESALQSDVKASSSSSSTAEAQPPSSSVFQPKPSTTGLFGQPASTPADSIFSSSSSSSSAASVKPSGLFGAQPPSSASAGNDSKSPAPFLFGAQKAPGNIFDSNPSKDIENANSKPFAPNAFSWNSKSNSAVPSNASSPGSVLAGGTAGMKDADAGGWSNPFTQENPLFLTRDDDDDDEEEEEEDEAGADAGADAEGAGSAEDASAPAQPEASSIFAAQPSSSSNSLFGRVTSTPTFNFGQPAPAKTGAVGLFGNATSATGNQTWTPDKGIKFGDRVENKDAASAPSASLFGSQTSAPLAAAGTSLFGSQNSAPASGSLFGGSSAAIPSFNFAQPANGSSIFSNPSSKPATPPVLFGGPAPALSSLAPPANMFGGPSPAPSDISTPGESSARGGGEDENEPSDEAGQQGGSTMDLSGKGPGEEDEDEVFETRSSIYNLNGGAYVKIGIGRLRVLKNRLNGRSRIVVKVETGKVLMNVGLRKELDYTKVSDAEAKGKVVKIIEFLPENKSRVWVMKVGTVELAQKLRKTLQENK